MLRTASMETSIVIYANADMPRRQTRLQPNPDEIVCCCIIGSEDYCQKRVDELGLTDESDDMIYRPDHPLGIVFNRRDLYKKVIEHGGQTFRPGPFKRFFVRRTLIDQFRTEINDLVNMLIAERNQGR